ncbi:hypothetical protein GTA08_BOTSDO03734 [Neofusicoccum parvum]|uniref:Uncharacterized protein n=1 Tax=Neofusicoccum parvum TaxID=310453 RepID=A0ACB5RUB4_9PEZI|nr:hypothetical protein GTA08_BOTSDO03734 [Neofusicoccum parvum]
MADSAEDRNMTENLLPLEVFTMLGIGVFVIVLRTIARINAVGVGAFQLDDYLMLVAAIIYGLETGTAYVILDWWEDMANSGMTPEARQSLDPDSREYYLRVGGSKTQIVQWTFYVLLLWTLKACMCLFYSRLTASLHEFEIRVKLGYALIGLTYLATQLCILLGCQPFHSSWQINPEPPNFCQPAISKLNLYTTLTLNIATDLYLLSIPVPMLWRANLAIWRRLSLLIVFSGGIFVILCGIMRCYIVLKDPVAGAQKATTWACRETFLAVLTTNAPVVYPLFRRGVERVASGSWKLSHIYRFSSDRSAWSEDPGKAQRQRLAD